MNESGKILRMGHELDDNVYQKAARRNRRRATALRIFLFLRAFGCLFGAARIAQVYDMDDWRVSGVVILLALAGVVSAWEAVLRAAAVKQ